jgi:hypothetical protein
MRLTDQDGKILVLLIRGKRRRGHMPAHSIVVRLLAMGLVLVLALWITAGCGGSGGEYGGSPQQEEQKAAPPVTGSFVGEAPDEEAFVAIVAASPEEEGQERDVRAYLCDGESVTEWFTGRAEGNELDLTSEGGARLEGNLSTEASTGTITLDDDRTLTYTAELARGVAGLYNVAISEEGRVRGASETGGLLDGQLGEEEDMRDEQARPIRGTLISTEGQEVGFEVFGREANPDEYRWIVFEDGVAKGAKKSVRTGSTSGFINDDLD